MQNVFLGPLLSILFHLAKISIRFAGQIAELYLNFFSQILCFCAKMLRMNIILLKLKVRGRGRVFWKITMIFFFNKTG